MDIKTLIEIKKIKEQLTTKLKKEGRSFKWFWENKILILKSDIYKPLIYTNFMSLINGNSTGLREDVKAKINEYVNEKF